MLSHPERQNAKGTVKRAKPKLSTLPRELDGLLDASIRNIEFGDQLIRWTRERLEMRTHLGNTVMFQQVLIEQALNKGIIIADQLGKVVRMLTRALTDPPPEHAQQYAFCLAHVKFILKLKGYYGKRAHDGAWGLVMRGYERRNN